MTVEPQKLWSDRAATKQQQIIKIKLNYAGILFSIKIIIWSYSTKLFSNLFYSIPNLNLQFIKGKACGNSRIYSSGQCNDNKRQEKILTGPVWFISVIHISNTCTLNGTSVSRWYCGRFAVFRGTLLGLRRPTDTKPLFHSLVMNQLESTDGLVFFEQHSFIKRKKHD